MMINHWWFQCRENCSVCWWRWTRPLPSCRFCYYWLYVIFFVINTTTIIMVILTRRKTLQRYLGLVASVGTRNVFGTSSSTESLRRYFYLYFIKVFVLNIFLYLCIQAANVVSWISMMFVVVSTIGMCVNTITALKVMDDNGNLKVLAMLPSISS